MLHVAAEQRSWWPLLHAEGLMNGKACPDEPKGVFLQAVCTASCACC